MTAPLPRWSRDGGPARALPSFDRDATGATWTDLANSEAGRMACGWAELPGVPAEVTMAQARVALLQAGLLPAVDAFVAASADEEAKIFWASSPTLHRESDRLADLAAAFGMSGAGLDALFIAAGLIP